jgi:hypothetical protein
MQINFIDGTFKVTPKYFTQTWIIRAYIGDSSVGLPSCYVFLEVYLL